MIKQQEKVVFYSFPSCSNTRHVRDWLKANKIEFVEKKVLREAISNEDILDVLKCSTSGFEDIINNKNMTEDIEDLKSSQLMSYICENPKILKKPLLIFQDELVVGWDKPKYRDISFKKAAQAK